MIKACLFDLDGTLLNTLTTIAHFGNLALKKYGLEPFDEESYKPFVGNGAKKLVERMLRARDAYSEDLYNKMYEYYMKSYDADPTYLSAPYEGIGEMLTNLKERGIKVGIISNKPDFAAKSVARAKLDADCIDDVQGQIEGVPIKPDVSGPMQVLARLGVVPSETIYIGDSGVDMQTGKNLGSYTIGVSWGFRGVEELKEKGADLVVDCPKEIINALDNINL